jgi:hypothetical protein
MDFGGASAGESQVISISRKVAELFQFKTLVDEVYLHHVRHS